MPKEVFVRLPMGGDTSHCYCLSLGPGPGNRLEMGVVTLSSFCWVSSLDKSCSSITMSLRGKRYSPIICAKSCGGVWRRLCLPCKSDSHICMKKRDDAGDYLCLCEAWKFSLSVRKPCKAQDAAFFLLPKWVFRELTVRWLMWLAHCRRNSTVDILYRFLQSCRLLGLTPSWKVVGSKLDQPDCLLWACMDMSG